MVEKEMDVDQREHCDLGLEMLRVDEGTLIHDIRVIERSTPFKIVSSEPPFPLLGASLTDDTTVAELFD